MDGIDRKAEEMGRTRTVRAAKAVNGPVGNGADGPCQVVFQVIGRPDGQGGDDVRFLPQVIDMPVHLLALAAVPGQAGSQVLPGRPGIDIVAGREMEAPFGTDDDILRFWQVQDECLITAVVILPFQDSLGIR